MQKQLQLTTNIASTLKHRFGVSPIFIFRRAYATTHSSNHGDARFQAGLVENVSGAPGPREPTRHLARLSTTHLIRSIILGSIFQSPRLSGLAVGMLKILTNPRNRLLNPDRNIILRAIVKATVYNHFCAGTSTHEVRARVAELKQQGFSGVMVAPGHETFVENRNDFTDGSAACQREVQAWQQLMQETLSMAGRGDYVGMKFTASGPSVTEYLLNDAAPPEPLLDAMNALLCQARAQGTKVWVDAEQQILQATIDRWTVDLMRKYNRPDEAVLYNTYQAYLKDVRPKLTAHLTAARDEKWVCGIKLVRGAYIRSDPRELIHDTKADTDSSYDGVVHDILTKSFGSGLEDDKFPSVELFVAGHNIHSIRKAAELSAGLILQGARTQPVRLGQLLGMADEASYELLDMVDDFKRAQLQQAREAADGGTAGNTRISLQHVEAYKCVHWGPVRACLHYMIRRATENQGAAARLADSVALMKQELWRRTNPF